MCQSADSLPGAYLALAQRLDSIPNGFPPTESGAELRLLAKLFTPEQAAIAAIMRLTAEEPTSIAGRAGIQPDCAYRSLKEMARNGLVRAERGDHGLAFALMPFVVGIYESQLPRMDVELARLFEDYFLEALGRGALSITPSVHRVIPVERSIAADIEVFPYESASQLLNDAKSFGVQDCICRLEQRLLGQGCDRPIENCLVFHPTEHAFERSPSIRTISKDEALQVLREATEAGLVHSAANVQQGHSYICNCCTCCCGILRGVSQFGNADSVARSSFRTLVDHEACSMCGVCVDVCPFGAPSLNESALVIVADRCMGCGVCVPRCPTQALSLHRRPEQPTSTPRDQAGWMQERARSRNIALEDIL